MALQKKERLSITPLSSKLNTSSNFENYLSSVPESHKIELLRKKFHKEIKTINFSCLGNKEATIFVSVQAKMLPDFTSGDGFSLVLEYVIE